ncbi:MAG: hypothetical protein LVQ75_00375 [Candidatus Babeliales bacterium]|jgi:hypothetical protein
MVIFNRFLLVIVLSFSALQAKGLREIAHLPHAQQLITKVFKERGVDPEDFEFTFSYNHWDFFYHPQSNSFTFDLKQLEILNKTQTLSNHFLQDLIDCGTYGFQTRENHLLSVQGIIGHELQHSFDRDELLKLFPIDLSERDFAKKAEKIRMLEARADLFASTDPRVLRATAKFFKKGYDYFRPAFLADDKQYSSYLNNIDPLHPTFIQRHDYLCAAATQLEQEGCGFNQR